MSDGPQHDLVDADHGAPSEESGSVSDRTSLKALAGGGTILGLYPRHKIAEEVGIADAQITFPSMTLAHNVASPEAVDAQLQEAVAAGATLVRPGQEVFWGGYAGYFADPDGHYWEVAWNPYF